MSEYVILIGEDLELVRGRLLVISEYLELMRQRLGLGDAYLVLVSKRLILMHHQLELANEYQNSMQHPQIVKVHNFKPLGVPNVFAAGFTSGFCFFSLRICEHGMVAQLGAGSFEERLPAKEPQAYGIIGTTTDNHLP